MSDEARKITRILACEVFEPALEHLKLFNRYPNLRVTYLPSNLHLIPGALKERLQNEILEAKAKNERVICLYGNCIPDMEGFCKEHGIDKIPGHYCYEMLLGTDRFEQLIDETAGTYFAEKDLILNFKEYCMRPLELDDEEIKKACFEHYHRFLYVRQPSDPDLMPRVNELADFLELSLDIRDADYSHIEKDITGLI